MGLHVGFFHDPDIVFVGGLWTAFKFFVLEHDPQAAASGARGFAQ
jgi:hypothetical protein